MQYLGQEKEKSKKLLMQFEHQTGQANGKVEMTLVVRYFL